MLADLSPGVAYAALATIVLVTLLFHFGGTLRERLARKQDPPKQVEAAVPQSASALPQAVDSATQAYERFIDHLLRQIQTDAAERDEIVARLIRERNDAQKQNELLQGEVMRLQQMLWRGP